MSLDSAPLSATLNPAAESVLIESSDEYPINLGLYSYVWENSTIIKAVVTIIQFMQSVREGMT